jgi:hypothetical protein
MTPTLRIHHSRETVQKPQGLASVAAGARGVLPATRDEHGGDIQRGDGCRTPVGACGHEGASEG